MGKQRRSLSTHVDEVVSAVGAPAKKMSNHTWGEDAIGRSEGGWRLSLINENAKLCCTATLSFG